MNKRIARIDLIVVAFIVFLLGAPIASKAKVFWTETFENGLYPNWIGGYGVDGNGCISASSPNGADCPYPQITTSLAYKGTHSLWSHYVEAGQQSGTFMDRYIPETANLWTRQYVRFNNFVFGPQNSKLFITGGPEAPVGVYWLFQSAGAELYPLVNHPTTVTCPNGYPDVTCNYTPNIAHIALNDNKWHCIETHQNSGTVNTADGLVELYVDGVLTTRYTNLLMKTTDHGYTIIRLYAQYGQGDRYQDDLAVGDTRIGCDGTPPALPAPPTGLTVE